MTVPAVIGHIDVLNGKQESVAGYLGECSGYDCRLFRTKADSEIWDRFMADIMRGKPPSVAEPQELGIGTDREFKFDAKAKPFRHSYVVITGTVTNKCRLHGESRCLDRSTDLHPNEIAEWRGAVPPNGPGKEYNQ